MERDTAIGLAASAMSPLVPEGSILVPIPSRYGYATDTLLLAKRIAEMSGAEVKDVLKGRRRMSSHEAKARGMILTPEDFGFYLTEDLEGRIVYIDNVIASGQTARAVHNLKAGMFLVYVCVTDVSGFEVRGRTMLHGNVFTKSQGIKRRPI